MNSDRNGRGVDDSGSEARQSSALSEASAPQSSEGRYRSLYRRTPVMMHSIDTAGRIVNVSDFWLASMGYAESEVIGRPSVDFLTEESKRYAREVVLPAFFRSGECTDIPYQMVRKDGRIIDVLLSGVAVRDEAGAITHSLAVLVDVTERNRALSALQRSEQRYQDLVNGLEGIVWELHHDALSFSFVSRQAERLLGFPLSRWLDEPGFWLEQVHERDREALQASLTAAAVGERAVAEFRMRSFSGEWVWLRCVSSAVPDSKPPLLRGVMVDISEQRQVQLSLESSERRHREIFEFAGVSLWEEDFSEVRRYLQELAPDGAAQLRRHFEQHPESVMQAAGLVRVENVNAETLELYGANSKEELLGALPTTFVPESFDVFRAELLAFAEGRPRFSSEAVVQTLRGERRNILMTSVFSSADEPKQRALISTLDITQRKSLEDQLRHAQKMEAVGQLAGGIAHDFNNLLAVILGRSELLLGMFPKERELVDHLTLIRETVEQASRLTSRLLAFSRRQVLQPRVANLNSIVADMMNMLRRLIGESVEIELTLANDLAAVRVDPGQIGQVVLNLALNARDAMPGGGKLSIRTFNAKSPNGEDAAVLTMSDTGHGMDEATRTRIFEPFFTTKGPGRGTGLGLATVYGIVKQSGGSIQVESAPQRGAVFSIYLPRADADAAPESAARDTEASVDGSETVLLVEDESSVRKIIARVLEESGYQVLQAANAAAAIEIAASHHDTIHLLLTDVVMPGVSGPELAARLRAERPAMGLLYVSGYTPEPSELGDARLLSKPFTTKALMAAVRDVLGGHPSGKLNRGGAGEA